jgi:hypothetical protein
MGYSQTKPLTHYPGEAMAGQGGQAGTPSSLQQLQNQVASHFNPMHITQTQHVQLGQGPHRLQLSQTQQMHMTAQQQQPMGGPQMGVSQQQSFSMMSQGQPANMREMQMMQEKMRQHQQQQQQQYMNRPPPDYKMHGAARPPYQGASAGPVQPQSQGGSTTPLQTMQNMVNQTPPYPAIKGEIGAPGVSQQGVTAMTQMAAVQSMASVNTSVGPHGNMTSSMAQASQGMAFQQQAVPPQQSAMPQRPPSYSPNTHTPTPTTPNGVPPTSSLCTTTAASSVNNNNGNGAGLVSGVATAVSSASTAHSHSVTSSVSGGGVSPAGGNSGYTSALMRNQRPPNVNVGPEGLNISQPRSHLTHPGHMAHPHPHPHGPESGWPRAPMMGAHHPQQMTVAGGRGGPMGAGMGQGMMPPGYSHRPGSAGAMSGGAMMGMGGAQVMMHQNVTMTQQQQQHLAMRQSSMGAQGGMPPHSSPYSNPMALQQQQQQQANGQHAAPQPYGAGLGQQDDFMQQFFTSEQSANFDSLSSDLFDDILK